jgi:hypothetical protein
MKLKAPDVDGRDVRDEVRNAILGHDRVSPDEKFDALRVLDRLSDVMNESMGASDLSSLRVVWSRVKEEREVGRSADMIEILGKQLASGVEHGTVVCSTGRISRIVGTLEGLEESAVSARPMWAVRSEIASLASRVRNEYASSDIEGQEAVASLEFRNRAMRIYCDELGMSPSLIEPMVQQFVEGF